MSKDEMDFGYFGKGLEGYAHYKQSFDDSFSEDNEEVYDECDDEEVYDECDDEEVYDECDDEEVYDECDDE